MMYDIIFSDLSLQQLKKLEKKINLRVISTLERCRVRPHSYVKKLVGYPYYRLRVGDYRVIMDIKQNELKIFIIVVGHRKNIYKNLK